MLDNLYNEMRRDRAEFARDVEYIKEMSSDDNLDSIICGGNSTLDSYKEANSLVNEMVDDFSFINEEVDIILSSDHDMELDEIIESAIQKGE